MKMKMGPTWNDLSEEVKVPADIAAAFASNRPELLKLSARDMSAEEVGGLLEAVRVLMETNAKLQAHSIQAAERAQNIAGAFFGFNGMLEKFANFAYFNDETAGDED